MSAITSIQYGTVTITSASTSNTATITSVDTTKSSIIYLGASNDNTNAPRPITDMARLTLTNATTVTATRNASGSTTVIVSFAVVTWGGGVTNNIQQGSIVIANSTASNTATITSVDTTKTILFWLGQETAANGASDENAWQAKLVLTNATTITASRNSAASVTTVTVGYVAVSFA